MLTVDRPVFVWIFLFCWCIVAGCGGIEQEKDRQPNILLIMSDNQSWNHLGVYGDSVVHTPHIDAVANEGARFTHAFCASPSCTPARAALLTGQDIYRLKQGANLWGTLPQAFKTYVDLLEAAGYQVGYEGKGWGPGNVEAGGRKRNPAGELYDSFDAFLQANGKNSRQPWHYWFSSKHPHRPYTVGAGRAAGIDSNHIRVPPYLPDVPEVRGDIADYYASIHDFDVEVKTLLETLEKSGQADNTLIIVCSDNGWQMPRGLANLYDSGTRVPLVVKWTGHVKSGTVIDDIVSLNDLAPTILNFAGISIPEEMTANNLQPLLTNGESTTSNHEYVVMARERHAFARQHGLGYPMRAIRTKDFLYIRNLEPTRWPAGDPPLFGDVDAHMLHYPAPTKRYLLKHREDAIGKELFDLAFAKRPDEELYDLRIDPYQLLNVAQSDAYFAAKGQLSKLLDNYLVRTGDPRVLDGPIIWDTTQYFQPRDFTPYPAQDAREQLRLKDRYDYLDDSVEGER